MTRTLRTLLTVLGSLIVGTVILFAQATHITTSGTLPTHCTPGDQYHKTGTGAGLYDCSATDTWTGPLSASTGSGTVTNTGTLTSGKTIVGNGTTDVTVSSLTANLVASSSGTLAGAVASANSRFLGSTSSGSGAAYSEMSGTTATALLDAMVGDSGSGGTKGLVPAPASGDAAAGKFLKADGTFAVPSGGGGGSGSLVLLEEHTASGSSSLDFTTRNVSGQSGNTIQSDYDEYEIRFVGIYPSGSSGGVLELLFSTNAGSSWDTGSNYGYTCWLWGLGTTLDHSQPTDGIRLDGALGDMSPDATSSYNGVLHLSLPSGGYAFLTGTLSSGRVTDGSSPRRAIGLTISGHYLSATNPNALSLKYTSPNIASGTIRVYGIAK